MSNPFARKPKRLWLVLIRFYVVWVLLLSLKLFHPVFLLKTELSLQVFHSQNLSQFSLERPLPISLQGQATSSRHTKTSASVVGKAGQCNYTIVY